MWIPCACDGQARITSFWHMVLGDTANPLHSRKGSISESFHNSIGHRGSNTHLDEKQRSHQRSPFPKGRSLGRSFRNVSVAIKDMRRLIAQRSTPAHRRSRRSEPRGPETSSMICRRRWFCEREEQVCIQKSRQVAYPSPKIHVAGRCGCCRFAPLWRIP